MGDELLVDPAAALQQLLLLLGGELVEGVEAVAQGLPEFISTYLLE